LFLVATSNAFFLEEQTMKRRLTLTLAVLLALPLGSLAFAGPAGQQQAPGKKTATGTIEKVNAKAKMIAVKPTASAQQIQTQTDIQGQEEKEQKDKPKRPRLLVFHVDENTKITSRIAQQQDAKGKPPEGGQKDPFGLLQPGQLVRVVYVQEKQEGKPGQQQQEKVEKGKQQQEKVDKGKQQGQEDKKRAAQQKQRKERVILRALSIDILKASDPQQQQKKKGPAGGQSQDK
jgi:hypothetical protein